MKNIKLRRLNLSDISTLAKLANNKNIWNNLKDRMPYPYNEKDAEFFINQTAQENPHQTFGIEHNEKLCGVIGLNIQNDVYRKSAEIGYWIGEPYWGKGIATRAVELLTIYGFNRLKLNRIYARVFENNISSMKVLEKNGFKKEGILKKAVLKNRKFIDEHRYYKLNDR